VTILISAFSLILHYGIFHIKINYLYSTRHYGSDQPKEDELGEVRNAHKILEGGPAEERLGGIDQSGVSIRLNSLSWRLL
jgi:hypothetical protein